MNFNIRLRVPVAAIACLFAACILTSCLTVERKTYKITLKNATSGSCKITYHNIVSSKDEGRDVSFKDFAELTTDYLEGDKLENEFPGARNLKSRLFESNGHVNGEVTFDFDSLATVKLYKYNNQAPLMMYLQSMSSESYKDGNGTYGGETMPIVFWTGDSKDLEIETSVTELDTSHVSLADHYKVWKKGKK